jgi:hypothetical protein
MSPRLLSLLAALAAALHTGCATTRRPVTYAEGTPLAFVGLFSPDGTPAALNGVDGPALERRLRERAPEVRWVEADRLDRPLRQALARPAEWPEAWIVGTLANAPVPGVDWAWHSARRPGEPVIFLATYPAGFTLEAATDSLVEAFGLRPPPPPPVPREEVPAAEDATPRVAQAGAEGVRAVPPVPAAGRYYVRGDPEWFENPITGERVPLSNGAVLGWVEFSAPGQPGRLVEGEAPVGARLEAADAAP